MKPLNVLLCVVFALSCGCAATKPQPVPPECANSLILPIKQEWIIGAGIIKIGVLEAIQQHPELKTPTLAVLRQLKNTLTPDEAIGYEPSYMGFATIVLSKIMALNNYVGRPSLIVATDIISQTFVQADVLIDPCDRDLLMRDIVQLEMLVGGI